MQTRIATHTMTLTLLLVGSLSTTVLAMDPKSLDELKLLRQTELASEGASACLRIVQGKAEKLTALDARSKLYVLQRTLEGYKYLDRVTLVARHLNGDTDPAWVGHVRTVVNTLGDQPDGDSAAQRCFAVSTAAIAATAPTKPVAPRKTR